jgi:hypothetical protein
MATRYSHRLVTEGLIYGIDFLNNKSYTSGSNTARNLVFDTILTTVTGSNLYGPPTLPVPIFNSGSLNFSGSQWMQKTGSLPFINPSGSFTVTLLVQPKTTGSLVGYNNFNIQIGPTSSIFGFFTENQNLSREVPIPNTSSFQHLTYRYLSGSFDFFINGLPVSASNSNSPVINFNGSNTLFLNSQAGLTRFPSSSFSQVYVYNRSLNADEIYQNYLTSTDRITVNKPNKPYTVDENVYEFANACNITDTTTINALNTFVVGLKNNNLWNKLVGIYPVVSSSLSIHSVNLKDPGVFGLQFTGSWTGSNTGSIPGTTSSYISMGDLSPVTLYPGLNSSSAHISYLTYDYPTTSSYLVGTYNSPSASSDLIINTASRVYHVFTSSATFSVFQPGYVEVFMVGGGGGAGGGVGGASAGIAGGGGAGGVVYRTSLYITASNYIVTVGTGGASPVAAANGFNGQNTAFGPLVAFGGGGGGIYTNGAGSQGASGGGGGGGTGNTVYVQGGDNIVGQGNSGGRADIRTAGTTVAGGGGGASEPGGFGNNTTATAGNGGSGSFFPQYAILTAGSGSPAGWYAGGGGGGAYSGTGGTGGLGGGSAGTDTSSPASGSPNTGGGGGGNGYTAVGGPGGSGIVIISYPTQSQQSTFGISVDSTSITGSINNTPINGIPISGGLSLVTVNRTSNTSLTIHNGYISSSFTTPASSSVQSPIFLNALNIGGTGSLNSPSKLLYSSFGLGLTPGETATYTRLVQQLQFNLQRFRYILDTTANAVMAVSVRKLRSAYQGSCMRVRRSSDNSETDIGFTLADALDVSSLLAFASTSSVYVKTWYDQSGGGRDLTQTTTTAQPLIVASGSLMPTPTGNLPVVSFGENSTISLYYTTPLPVQQATAYCVYYNPTQNSPITERIVWSTAGGSDPYWVSNNNLFSTTVANFSILNNTTPSLMNSYHSGSLMEVYLNRSYQSNNTRNFSSGSGIALAQRYGTTGRNLLGYIQEFIVLNEHITGSRATFEPNINSYYQVY